MEDMKKVLTIERESGNDTEQVQKIIFI